MSPDSWCLPVLIFDPRVVVFLYHVTVRKTRANLLHIYYTTLKPLTCQIFGYFSREYMQYIALTRSFFAAQNPPHIVGWLGYAQTRWGSFQRSPEPLAVFRGSTSTVRRGRAGRGRGGKIGEGRGRGRKGLREIG